MLHAVLVELKLLEVEPVPENLSVLDLSWYEVYEYLSAPFTVWKRRQRSCCKPGADCLTWFLFYFVLFKEHARMCPSLGV